MARPILFLTDYGLRDEFVGVCHAVLARLAPGARVIDLAHGIPGGDVLAGALALAEAVPYAPPGAVYLAVVDPGVGTERRAVALEAGGSSLVGPDNGVLAPAARALGGVQRAVALDPGRYAPGPVSATFHGRDVFAPAAARLAAGSVLEDLGPGLDPGGLVVVEPEEPAVDRERVSTSVLSVDGFGNVRLAVRPDHLRAASLEGDLVLRSDDRSVTLRRVRTFADLRQGETGLLEDSGGWLAVVANRGNAAGATGLRPGAVVVLTAVTDTVG